MKVDSLVNEYGRSVPEPVSDDHPKSVLRGHLGSALLRVAIVVFSVEALIMWALETADARIAGWDKTLLDASALTLISGLILYVWIIKPLNIQLMTTIEALCQAKAEAEHLSQIDPLTGVLNRRTFFERVERKWEEFTRSEAALSCIMIDLDYFKRVNDTYGHLVGDAVLKNIAAVLDRQCGSDWELCRYGGEEFCVLLLDSGMDGATVFADQLSSAIARTCVRHRGEEIHVTASFGVAHRSASMSQASELVDAADQALLRAKQAGRNRVESAQSDCDSQSQTLVSV